MPLRSLRRRVLAVFGVVAVVASVVVVGSSSVSAKPGKADNPASYSACVGPATESAGLPDVVGTSVEDAVNCLKHYKITEGTSAGVYDAGAAVSRWQMALFLVRAAGPAGVTLRAGADQGFTDIGGLSPDTQKAINQLAELGISKGMSATTFAPDRAVTRGQMALFLRRFLDNATIGPGGVSGVTQPAVPVHAVSLVAPDDQVFTDVNQVPVETYRAIRLLYELGVTEGVTETAFGPSATVTRGQMASFITRALAHTNARPAGVTIQVASASSFDEAISAVVSVRDENHLPPRLARVDWFTATAAKAGSAFVAKEGKDKGKCDGPDILGWSGLQCEMDIGDPATDEFGNLADDVVSLSVSGTMWAWTAALGTKFNIDDHGDSVASVAVTVNPDAAEIALSTTLPKGADDEQVSKARFGTEVTVAIQLVDADKQPVAKADQEISVTQNLASADGSTNVFTEDMKTDAAGKVTIAVTENDPKPREFGQTAQLGVTATWEESDLEGVTVTWTDEPSEVTAISVSFPRGDNARAVAKSTTPPVAAAINTVVAKVTDQFGGPVGSRLVRFTSDDTETPFLNAIPGEGTPDEGTAGVNDRTTRAGVATLFYGRDSAVSKLETITATVLDREEAETDVTGTADMRWYQYCTDTPRPRSTEPASTCSDIDTALPANIFADRNTILIRRTGGTFDMARYGPLDNFTFSGVNMASTAAFEAALANHMTNRPTDTYTVTIPHYQSPYSPTRGVSHIVVNPVPTGP